MLKKLIVHLRKKFLIIYPSINSPRMHWYVYRAGKWIKSDLMHNKLMLKYESMMGVFARSALKLLEVIEV